MKPFSPLTFTCLTAAGLFTPAAHAINVSTAFGNGADVQLVASTAAGGTIPNDSASRNDTLNTRLNVSTSGGTSNNDIIALRFDLSGYDLSTAQNVTLNLFSYRDDGSARSVQVLGVTPFTTGLDNNGTIAGFNTTNWNEATVIFSTMPGLEWDNIIGTSDFDLVTASISTLETKSLTAADLDIGTQITFSNAALSTFLQSHTTTNQVTFLLRAGNTSAGQARFASKEATGLNGSTGAVAAGTYAPFLSFTADLTAIPEPAAFGSLAGLAVLACASFRRARRG